MTTTTRSPTFALALVAVLAGCGTGEARLEDRHAAAKPDAPLPVQTVPAYRADFYATFDTTATIEADAEAPVPARVAGEILEILVEEGDTVAAGQLLARIDGARLELETREAEARLKMASRELARLARLEERGLVSRAAVESLIFQRDALAAARNLMRLDYGYTGIRAPIAGIVSARSINRGTHVAVGAPTFSVTGTSRLVAHLLIPQTELSRISTGNEVRVTVDAQPGRQVRTRIDRISPTIDVNNGTFRATAYIANEDGMLAPGMFGRFSIAYEKYQAALLVPSHAVLREDSENVVYVVAGGAAERRIVTLGIESGGAVQVLDGLEESEKVVVAGHGSLRDGSRVAAAGETTEASAG